MLEEEGLYISVAEEAYGRRDGGDGVWVLADERAAEDDVLHVGLRAGVKGRREVLGLTERSVRGRSISQRTTPFS